MNNLIKSTFIATALAGSFFVAGCNQSKLPDEQHQTKSSNAAVAQNKQLVEDFYQGVFQKHEVKAYSDKYLSQDYIQHNPYIATGRQPFVDYFTDFYKQNPQAKASIKRMIAEGDLVAVHAHSVQDNQDKGLAVVDIFRIEKDKIVEHWDVIQPVTESNQNSNGIF